MLDIALAWLSGQPCCNCRYEHQLSPALLLVWTNKGTKCIVNVCTDLHCKRCRKEKNLPLLSENLLLQQVPCEALLTPTRPLASPGKRQRCRGAAEPPAPWSSSPRGPTPWNAPSSCRLPVCPVGRGGVEVWEPRCRHWGTLGTQEASRDLDNTLPAPPPLFSSPSPLLATAGAPPRAAGEWMLESQEEVGTTTAEGNRRRDCQPSFPP